MASSRPRYPEKAAGVRTSISPTPSGPGPVIRTMTPGSGRPAQPGLVVASPVGNAVTPDPASVRP